MKRIPHIETDTPLVVSAVAIAVWEEASVRRDESLPRDWVRKLIEQANTTYAHDPSFRRKIRGPGNTGRRWLWAFMHHSLAVLIQERRAQRRARMPSTDNPGLSLPAESSPFPPSKPEYAWAAAAHFHFS